MQRERGSSLNGDAELVRRFLAERFLFDADAAIEPSASLLGEGVLDSTGAMELVLFLEDSFRVTVDDEELVPENLDSIERVVAFVERKRARASLGRALDANAPGAANFVEALKVQNHELKTCKLQTRDLQTRDLQTRELQAPEVEAPKAQTPETEDARASAR
jgi:acyl carrier protein